MLVKLTVLLAVAVVASTSHTSNQNPLRLATPRYPLPGGTPWRNCVDPTNHLFQIDHAGMDPNPCMVYVHVISIDILQSLWRTCLALGTNRICSESLCKVNITGTLTKNITNATISWDIAPHFDDGRVGSIPGVDNFYRWVNVYQDGTKTQHLQTGPALMNQSFLLLGGWVPVVGCSTSLCVLLFTAHTTRPITVLYSMSRPLRALCSAFALIGR